MKHDAFGDAMNSHDEQFDRLVDGSLSPDEYRALVAALDEEPGGWRKCALAFLEAQALAQELGGIIRASPVESKRTPLATRPTTWKHVSLALAMAASFLGAIAIGIFSPQLFREQRQEPAVAGNLKLQTPDKTPLATANGERYEVFRPVGSVNVVVDGLEGAGSAGQVPVYEVGGELDAILARDDAALGPELIELFQRCGFDVRHEQQYVPAPLEDGRQVIVPLQGYEIRPVSRTY